MHSKNILYITMALFILLILGIVVYSTFLKDIDNFGNNKLESDLVLPKITQTEKDIENEKPQFSPPSEQLDDGENIDDVQVQPVSPSDEEEVQEEPEYQPEPELPLPSDEEEVQEEPEYQPKEHIISITSEGFIPQIITINLGDIITWVNNDTELHWPASDPDPTHTGLPGLDPLSDLFPGETFSFTFNIVGVFTYHDHTQAIEGSNLTSTGGIRVLDIDS